MIFPNPRIHIITTLAEAYDAGCDCVMRKFDGWPVRVNCTGDGVTVYSDAYFNHGTELAKAVPVEPLTALMIGAKPRGDTVDHIWLYDTWWMDGQDVQHLTYRERHVLTRCNVKKLDPRFEAVPIYPIAHAQTLWRDSTMPGYKGLVFRYSRGNAAGDLYVIRHYPEMPKELI